MPEARALPVVLDDQVAGHAGLSGAQPGEGRHDDAVGQLQVAQGDGGEQVHDGSKAAGHGPHSGVRSRSLRASKVSRVADPRTRRPLYAVVLAAVLALAGCSSDGATTAARRPRSRPRPTAQGTDPLPPLPDDVALPIVFVHGFAGSAQQYESQGHALRRQRLPAGPDRRLRPRRRRPRHRGLRRGPDEVVDETLAEFGVEQVYLVGHSRGTARVEPLPGRPGAGGEGGQVRRHRRPALPRAAVVPCIAPDAGEVPRPVPRRGGDVEGVVRRAVRVPRRRGARGGRHRAAARAGRDLGPGGQLPGQHRARAPTLDIWAIDADTGARIGDEPHASVELGPGRRVRPGRARDRRPLRVRAELRRHAPSSTTSTCSPTCAAATSCACCPPRPTAPPGRTPTPATTTPRWSIIRMREWHAARATPTSSSSAWTAASRSDVDHRLRRQRRHRPPRPRRRRHARGDARSRRCRTSPSSRSRAASTCSCPPRPTPTARSRPATCPAATPAARRRSTCRTGRRAGTP